MTNGDSISPSLRDGDQPMPSHSTEPPGHRSRRARTASVAAVALVAGTVGGGLGMLVTTAASGAGATSVASRAPLSATSTSRGPQLTNVERVARTVSPSVVLLQVQGRQSADEGSG
jgi:putative serine protease PepD